MTDRRVEAPSRDHTRRQVLVYATIFLVLGAGLVAVLPAGQRIVPAPQAAEAVVVTGAGVGCLGERLAVSQSGVYVNLGAPDSVASLSGQIDRLSGEGELDGSCPEGSRLAGAAAVATVAIDASGSLRGVVSVGSDRMEYEGTPAVEGETGVAQDPLQGAELLTRTLLALIVVIAAARLLGQLFSKINQPRVIGEIVAGILLGPSLVGLIAPGITEYLFPTAVTGVLYILAQFGLIFFMFLIGLELDHKLIRGSGHTAVLISHYSIVIPFVLGLAIALAVYPRVGAGDFTGFALFMGAAMAITAFPVLARILTDTGLHKTRLGALAITCAAVDDVTAWCVLAVVVAIVKSGGPLDALWTVGMSAVFVLVMLSVVRPLLSRVASVHASRGKLGAPVMSGLIILLLVSAWTTEYIGIHAIFGAFLLGAIIPRTGGLAEQITERLEDLTVLFLLPVFFAVVGLRTQIGLVSGGELWALTGLIILAAIVGKVGGSLVAGLASGENTRSSVIVGVLMNARGITEIVILTIGISLGVISPALFTMMVMMALVTTFMTTPLLTKLYPPEMARRDRRVVAPSRVMGGTRTVMIGVTDAKAAEPLVTLTANLAPSDPAATVRAVLARVVPPPGHEELRASLANIDSAEESAERVLEEVRWAMEERGIPTTIATDVGDEVAERLAALATEHRADLLLVGSHEAYLGFRPLAGVAGDLLRDAPCDVAVLVGVGTHRSTDGPVGVWYPGGDAGVHVLEVAADLARGQGRRLRVISPVPTDLPDLGVDVEGVTLDRPTVAAALDAVESTSIVVVTPPGLIDGLLPGLREAVLERASVPVLVYRHADAYPPPSSSQSGTEPIGSRPADAVRRRSGPDERSS